MSDKNSKKTTASKSKTNNRKTVKKSREYTDLTLIIIVAVVVGLSILIGNLIKNNKSAQATPTATLASVQQVQGTGEAQDTGETVMQWDSAPAMAIDTSKSYIATVKMAKGGEFVIQLYPDKAPVTVNNFVFLAANGYYDGVTFHRVLEDFMAQTGDPTGTGGGGPGYQFENEDSDLRFDKEGVVAMANAGRDTNGSQFFITFGPAEYLNGDYTIFGQVISGMDVVKGITLRDPRYNPDYTGDVIESITISVQDYE
jgi:cyclophilin family peptidyl-prolyl cis-trans isomerase